MQMACMYFVQDFYLEIILFTVSLPLLRCKCTVYGVFEVMKQPFSVMVVEIVAFSFSHKVVSVHQVNVLRTRGQ